MELLQKEGERARKLDGQVQALTAALIDRDEVVERLRAHPKFLTEAHWEHLRQLTDKAYTGISERLTSRFPQLTPADLQLADAPALYEHTDSNAYGCLSRFCLSAEVPLEKAADTGG